MTPKILWDATAERLFETGIDRGVLYPMDVNGEYPAGVAWNGIVSITESPSGAEASPFYADNVKYLNLMSAEEFGCTIEAFTYPDEFGVCDGTAAPTEGVLVGQQARKQFGLSYRTKIGNDVVGQELGYKLHLVFGALAAPSEKSYNTINESPEPITFSWEVTTTPVALTGYKPTSSLTIDSTKVDSTKLAAFEVILYGVAGAPGIAARMPLPAEVITLMTPG
jgi:hypothetical protein